MPGVDQTNGSLFSNVSLEDNGPPDHPLRASAAWRSMFCPGCPSSSRSCIPASAGRRSRRKTVAGVAAAGIRYDPFGTPVDGATGPQTPVPPVGWADDRRCGVGRRRVLQESSLVPESGSVRAPGKLDLPRQVKRSVIRCVGGHAGGGDGGVTALDRRWGTAASERHRRSVAAWVAAVDFELFRPNPEVALACSDGAGGGPPPQLPYRGPESPADKATYARITPRHLSHADFAPPPLLKPGWLRFPSDPFSPVGLRDRGL